MQNVGEAFPVTEEEYLELDEKYGKLCHHQSWKLYRRNLSNNCLDDRDDMLQEIRIALLTAGSYYKRQSWIENSFTVLSKHLPELSLLEELKVLWSNRRRHGAGKQKFGPEQEIVLEELLKEVPAEVRPKKDAPLKMDGRFAAYVKGITWNRQKTMGRKITKERDVRTSMVSIYENNFLSPSVG